MKVPSGKHSSTVYEDLSRYGHEAQMRKRQQRSYHLRAMFEAIDYHRDGTIRATQVAQFRRGLLKRNREMAGLFGEIIRLSQLPIEDTVRRVDDDYESGLNRYPEPVEHLIDSIDEIVELSRAELVLGYWILPSMLRRRPEAVAVAPPTQDHLPTMGPAAVVVARPSTLGTLVQRIRTGDYDELLKVLKHLTAGGVAGAVSRTAVSPLERMKILFQVQGPGVGSYQGIIPSFLKITREEGVLGYFKGNGTNIIRIVPYSAIQFASYERYKKVGDRQVA
jgi:hypothetical protein